MNLFHLFLHYYIYPWIMILCLNLYLSESVVLPKLHSQSPSFITTYTLPPSTTAKTSTYPSERPLQSSPMGHPHDPSEANGLQKSSVASLSHKLQSTRHQASQPRGQDRLGPNKVDSGEDDNGQGHDGGRVGFREVRNHDNTSPFTTTSPVHTRLTRPKFSSSSVSPPAATPSPLAYDVLHPATPRTGFHESSMVQGSNPNSHDSERSQTAAALPALFKEENRHQPSSTGMKASHNALYPFLPDIGKGASPLFVQLAGQALHQLSKRSISRRHPNYHTNRRRSPSSPSSSTPVPPPPPFLQGRSGDTSTDLNDFVRNRGRECETNPESSSPMFTCPSLDINGRYVCIEESQLCNKEYNCPLGEDEDGVACLFRKTMLLHIKQLIDVFMEINRI